MVNKNRLIAWLLILAGSSTNVISSEGHSAHGVHVHGEAILNIVLDGDTLYIELDSPAINLIGFEHAPSSDEQKAVILNAQQTLTVADRLFHFATAKCPLENLTIEVPYINNSGSQGHSHHHDHQHSHEEAHHEHANFHASYTFQCEQVKDLKAVSTTLFSLFPGIQVIKAQWISQGRQGSTSLTANNSTLKIN